MADEVTITRADVERVAGVIDDETLTDEDRRVLHGVFYLAGTAFAAATDPEVEGFMPAYMKLGDIKGDVSSATSVRLVTSVQYPLANSFGQGAAAHGAGGGGGAGKVSVHDISI